MEGLRTNISRFCKLWNINHASLASLPEPQYSKSTRPTFDCYFEILIKTIRYP